MKLRNDEFAQFLQTIKHNKPELISLELRCKTISEKQAIEIANALGKNNYITEIDLSFSEIEGEGLSHLATIFKSQKNIVSIILKLNNLAKSGEKAIADTIKDNDHIINLDLEYTNLSTEGIKYLADSLGNNKCIQTINLAHNKIGIEGAQYLAKSLKHKTHITNINLSYNEIGTEGAQYIFDGLKENVHLVHINLFFNKIGSNATPYLAYLINNNQIKSNINLSYNDLTEEDAKYLAKSLTNNKWITSLNLCYTEISDRYEKSIADDLEKNKIITTIGLMGDNIKEVIARNKELLDKSLDTMMSNKALTPDMNDTLKLHIAKIPKYNIYKSIYEYTQDLLPNIDLGAKLGKILKITDLGRHIGEYLTNQDLESLNFVIKSSKYLPGSKKQLTMPLSIENQDIVTNESEADIAKKDQPKSIFECCTIMCVTDIIYDNPVLNFNKKFNFFDLDPKAAARAEREALEYLPRVDNVWQINFDQAFQNNLAMNNLALSPSGIIFLMAAFASFES